MYARAEKRKKEEGGERRKEEGRINRCDYDND